MKGLVEDLLLLARLGPGAPERNATGRLSVLAAMPAAMQHGCPGRPVTLSAPSPSSSLATRPTPPAFAKPADQRPVSHPAAAQSPWRPASKLVGAVVEVRDNGARSG